MGDFEWAKEIEHHISAIGNRYISLSKQVPHQINP